MARAPSYRRCALAVTICLAGALTSAVAARATPASAAAAVRHCPAFVVYRYHNQYGSGSYRASHILSSSRLSCRMADHLLRAAYGQGPLKIIRTVYRRTPSGQEYGRPTFWVRGGWRATNGAGGAVCWNAVHHAYNSVSVPYISMRYSVTADVS